MIPLAQWNVRALRLGQANLAAAQALMDQWASEPFFERRNKPLTTTNFEVPPRAKLARSVARLLRRDCCCRCPRQ